MKQWLAKAFSRENRIIFWLAVLSVLVIITFILVFTLLMFFFVFDGKTPMWVNAICGGSAVLVGRLFDNFVTKPWARRLGVKW